MGETVDIGCCVSMDRVATLEQARADYYELPVASTVMAAIDEPAFAGLLDQTSTYRLPPRAFNVFLPAELPVVGASVDRDGLDRYVPVAFDRVRRLGGRIVVFGSGRARSIPATFSRDAALDQLAAFLRWTSALAGECGIGLALEPLRRPESNVFNSLHEGAAFIRQRGLADVRLVADLFHMMEEGEPLTVLQEHADLIAHAHIADRDRRPPGLGDYPLVEFFRGLRQSGYGGDCSIECTWTDFSGQIAPALAHTRQAARAAGW
jgi:sugar phosphate isomerase/epimerase